VLTQIYEIQTPHEAEKCIVLGVDHIGSVLLSHEDWKIPTLKEVVQLCKDAEVKSSLIPLFQDKNILQKALDYYQPSFVHFCDNLTDQHGRQLDLNGFVQLQNELKKRFSAIGIIRSIPVPPPNLMPKFPTLQIAEVLEPFSDFFLTDTWVGQEPVKGFIGITGQPADWEMARKLVVKSNIPVILAGGLSPENVYEAILDVLPAGADSCTLTNKVSDKGAPERFQKDFEKVEKFVEEVERAETQIRRMRNEQDTDALER
jgi:phosphoribosylanthranilate isomerase